MNCTPFYLVLFFVIFSLTLSLSKAQNEERVYIEKLLSVNNNNNNAQSSSSPIFAPDHWVMNEKPISHYTEVKLTFALKHRNVELMEQLLDAVSDPFSDSYGKHLSMQDIGDHFAPPAESPQYITQWIRKFDPNAKIQVSRNREFLSAITTAGKAQKLLHCEFHEFQHKYYDTARVSRCSSMYTLPKSVAQLVDFVGGVIHFPRIDPIKIDRKYAQQGSDGAQAGLAVDPHLIRKLYKTQDVTATHHQGKQGVAQFLNQYYSQGDLEEFFDLFSRDLRHHKPVVVGPNDGSPGTEASLDIEYVMAVGRNVTSYFWSVEDAKSNQEPFLDWILQVHNYTNPPQVFSVSYGDEEKSLTDAYVHRVSQEFQKAGLRGISILFASGDSGVGGHSFGCSEFVPDFPASSPHVTAVGGTKLGILETGPEKVNSLSGGGFSNFFARPSYQSDAVDHYFDTAEGLPPKSKYNHTSRGYPDVSALSSGFVVVIDRIPMPGVAGTSCASPTFAGVVSLLNDIRLNAGKSPLGFLNPFIYKMAPKYPHAFTDITEGSNPGCGTDGFPAAKGWDPSSGWGSPNYEVLSKIVKSLK
eukprot:gb/GECH01011709.1/.p1 GENE.gb/GECH01011709.1/~~gb/GECH01011709.1/.p1  ORF type:complete len:583 (+),score=146.86 gb/GECH01011709.1/:1-1749(+)